MKQQTLLNKSRWLFVCLLSFMMTLGGASSAWADTYTETFDAVTVTSRYLLSNGWIMVHNNGNYQGFGGSYDYQIKSGNYDGETGNSLFCDYSDNNEYVVIPTKLSGTFSYYVKRSSSSNGTITFFEATKEGDVFTVTNTQLAASSTSSSWSSKSFELGDEGKYVAIRLLKSRIDQISATIYQEASGSGFAVKDGSATIASPYAYNFGLATAGTTKVFKLANPGTAETPITIDVTGANGFTATVESNATSIPAGGEKELTITMPAASASGSIVVTPTGDGLSSFTFNVSGTIRDANKVYEYGFTALPEDWTTSGTWYYSEANGAYTTVWYLTSNARLVTPKLTIAEGEKFFVEAKGYSTSNTSYQHLQMQYSADGTTWTNFGAEPSLDPSNWNTFEFTGVPAGNYYIAINASQADIRMFYGGELPNEPKMVVTQPTSLAFGVVDKDATAPTKTFTIANTGKATLEGINVTSSNAAFTITNAPTSLAAGASQEVTITMSTVAVGNLSSDITISATGMNNVQFTVTGTVMPTGLSVIDFNDNQLPARWENTGWTFANGAAYAAYHNPAYVMTTPKIVVNAGDMFVIKGKIEYNSSSYYVTVKGLNSNSEEVYSKKLTNDVFNNTDYTAVLLSDVPATVEKLQFVGYYGYIDEIQGINYAASLSVTTGDPAATVTSPANCDFGECAADAHVTYNFANAGAGTINITNVAITGDGAAAYSTNWTTSVAAPFDLVITRTYDANREGASEAVVTVATTEGDFVINVIGTDKAANAPELAVSTTAVNFGKVTADAVETVTVANNGTGSMTVNIYSSSSDFTVSPALLTGIGAGESKTFDITFKYGTPYGVKNADVIVTPTYNGEAAINITVTGKAKDPATWSEDFAGNTLPLGWSMDDNWTIEEGVAKGSYSLSGSYYLTTAPLTVNATTDELTFDYAATANYVSIKIQMSKDGAAFTDLHTISGLNNGDAGSYTITGLEAGDYQFRFKNDDYNLDNFEGFVLNLPDHMANITTYTIPASSSYSVTMKESQSFEATVTVKELRGVAENLTAKLYMGDEVIGTKAGSVAANGTETLTITCTPTVAAPSGAEMHIEVEWAGATMSTETVTRYVAAITYLTLDETSSDAVVAGTYDNVTLKRTFNAGWNTACLPFAISDVEAFFGTGAKAYDFTSYTNGELGFTTVSSLTASYPYIVYVPSAITDDILLNDITIASVDATAFYRNQSGAYFRGTYAPIAAGGWTKTIETDVVYGVTSAGKIAKAGASATMKGFRAYFDLPAGSSARLAIYDDATGITTILDAKELNNDGKVYNLNGQRVENAHKGLYIVNGKKVIVK